MTLKNSRHNELVDGIYKYGKGSERQVFYVEREGDDFQLFKTSRINKQYTVDSLQPTISLQQLDASGSFSTSDLDIDLFAIPFKLRTSFSGVPAQLNTNLNGAVFLGHQTDLFKVHFERNPFNKVTSEVSHFGYSLGVFTGFGNTAMTPTTTGNFISTEYDGIVWLKGIAAIIAINNFSAGLALGFDNLLDRNNDSWIYESKPWLGLALGLNLN